MKEPSFLRQWQVASVIRDMDGFTIGEGVDVAYLVLEADYVVRKVLRDRGKLFRYEYSQSTGRWRNQNTELGKRLLQCLRANFRLAETTYPRHCFSPYFELLAKELSRTTKLYFLTCGPDTYFHFNEFVEQLRAAARATGFKKVMASQKRMVRENLKSLQRYIDDLFDQYSKLLVVRVDLRYSKEYRESCEGHEVSPEHVRKCFNDFMHHFERQFPAKVGYAWKLEYGPILGYHYHFLVFFNGHEVREDETLGHMVGQRWAEKAEGGSFWNCNIDKERYTKQGSLGIGMVRYNDDELRRNLERAASYLVKIDDYVRLKLPEGWKAFSHGVHRTSEQKRGRPRSFKQELAFRVNRLKKPSLG